MGLPNSVYAWRRASSGAHVGVRCCHLSHAHDETPTRGRVLGPMDDGRRIGGDSLACLSCIKRRLCLRRQNAANGFDHCARAVCFRSELPAARRAQAVKARLAMVFAGSPKRRAPAMIFQTMERRIERTWFDRQSIIAGLLDDVRGDMAMSWPHDSCAQGEHVERAKHQFLRFLGSGHDFSIEFRLVNTIHHEPDFTSLGKFEAVFGRCWISEPLAQCGFGLLPPTDTVRGGMCALINHSFEPATPRQQRLKSSFSLPGW